MLGALLVCSLDTAERINIAMEGRGFDGRWRTLSRLRIGRYDLLFVLIAVFFMFGLYIFVRPVL